MPFCNEAGACVMAFFRQLIDLGHGSTVAAPVNGSRRTEGTRNNSRGSIALAISRFASGENRALKLRVVQSSEYRQIRDKDISRETGVVFIGNCEVSQFRTCDRVSRCLATIGA